VCMSECRCCAAAEGWLVPVLCFAFFVAMLGSLAWRLGSRERGTKYLRKCNIRNVQQLLQCETPLSLYEYISIKTHILALSLTHNIIIICDIFYNIFIIITPLMIACAWAAVRKSSHTYLK
jgi:hypothetical protein